MSDSEHGSNQELHDEWFCLSKFEHNKIVEGFMKFLLGDEVFNEFPLRVSNASPADSKMTIRRITDMTGVSEACVVERDPVLVMWSDLKRML